MYNKKLVSRYMIVANEVLKEKNTGIVNCEGLIPKTYKGYVASLGPSIIQSGLLPAVSFYESSTGSDVGKKHIIQVLFKILFPVEKEDSFFDFLCQQISGDKMAEQRIKQELFNAITALKMVMNTYQFEEKVKDVEIG